MKQLLKVTAKGLGAFIFGIVLGFVITFGVPVNAADGMVTFSTGTKLPAASLNLIVTAFRTGRFYDSAGAGSNYIGVSHNGTDAVLTTNTGDVRISAPTGSTVDLEINGTDVGVIGANGVTVSQTLYGQGGGFSGSVEIDGTTKLDGVTTITGAATLSGTNTFSGTTTTSGAATFTNGTATVFNSGVKPSTGSDTIDNYDKNATCTPTYGGTGTLGSCTYTVQVCNYNRIGNLVNLSAIVTWTACGTPPVGQPFIDIGTAPPFANISNYRGMCAIGIGTGYALTAGNIMSAYGQNNSTRIYLNEQTTGGGGAAAPIDTAANITVGCSYQTD
jgi:hypothetical protein